MEHAEANQLMKDFAEQILKQQTLIAMYRNESAEMDFVRKQTGRTTVIASVEANRRMSALQDEIKALEARVEEEKRKVVEANLKLAQASRAVEKMERALCLDSPKGWCRNIL